MNGSSSVIKVYITKDVMRINQKKKENWKAEILRYESQQTHTLLNDVRQIEWSIKFSNLIKNCFVFSYLSHIFFLIRNHKFIRNSIILTNINRFIILISLHKLSINNI